MEVGLQSRGALIIRAWRFFVLQNTCLARSKRKTHYDRCLWFFGIDWWVRWAAMRMAPYCLKGVPSTREGYVQEQGTPEWFITSKIVRRALRDRRVTAGHPSSAWLVFGLLLLLLVSGITYSSFSLHSHDSYQVLRREGVCRSRSLNF